MSDLPATIDVYPGWVVPATGARFTDDSGRQFSPALALALWHLARALDGAGQGRVPLADLRAAGRKLWRKHTYCRALREAQALELVEVVERRADGELVVVYRSALKVADWLGLQHVGARKVTIPVSALRSAKAFKAALWAAYHAGRIQNTGRPISRDTLTELTGVSRRTQRRYEASTGHVTATRNSVVVGHGLGDLRAAREFIHGGCFIPGGSPTGPVHQPLPNSYRATLPLGSRSAARKLNRTLSGALLISPGGQHKRVFFESAAKAEKAMRRGNAADVTLVPDGPGLWRRLIDGWAERWVYGVV